MTDAPLSAAEVAQLLEAALGRPAPEGARIVALHWLHGLLAARGDWAAAVASDEGEPEARHEAAVGALHKARVNLRRLRSTLREHRDTLALDEGRRVHRALQHLGAATNETRDRDAQGEWLAQHRADLSDAAREEADRMQARLRTGGRKRQARVSRAFARDVDPHADTLAERLGHYAMTHAVGRPRHDVTFAEHLADCLRDGIVAIGAELESSLQLNEPHLLHGLRIRLKRQRAMLAAFAERKPAIGAWYALATRGQDLLGTMRDATLLAERAEAQGFQALATYARSIAGREYDAFCVSWVNNAASVLSVAHAAQSVLRESPATDATNVSAAVAAPDVIDGFPMPGGHGLPMEIERKYLLHGLPPLAAMAPSVRIEQGWLPGNILRERLRRSIAANGTVLHTRTIKLGRPGARIEIEEPVEPSLFDALWPHTVDARIRKRRHLVTDGPWTWEIDVFLDRDLVLAEIELDDALRQVELPSWLAPFVVRDVTHDSAYLNAVMAQRDIAAPERESR